MLDDTTPDNRHILLKSVLSLMHSTQHRTTQNNTQKQRMVSSLNRGWITSSSYVCGSMMLSIYTRIIPFYATSIFSWDSLAYLSLCSESIPATNLLPTFAIEFAFSATLTVGMNFTESNMSTLSLRDSGPQKKLNSTTYMTYACGWQQSSGVAIEKLFWVSFQDQTPLDLSSAVS